MKSFCVIALAVVAICAGEEGYTSDKGVDIAEVVGNVENLKAFVSCFSEKTDCNPQASAFKKDLPEALAQACAKCTPVQKHNVRLFLEALKKHLPEEEKDFKKKYDSENKLFPKLEAAVADF